MAITTGNPQSTRSTTNANTYTLASYNVASGSNRVLAVLVSLMRTNENAINPTGVTFGGVALTAAGTAATGISTSRSYYARIWYLVNPSVSTADIVVSAGATMAGAIVSAVTLYGVDQSTPVGVTVADSVTTDTLWLYSETGVTSGSLGILMAVANAASNPTWDLGDPVQTELYDLNNGSNDNAEIAGAAGYHLTTLFLGNVRAGGYAMCGFAPARQVGTMVEFLPASAASQSVTPSTGISTVETFGGLGIGLNMVAVGAIASAGAVPSPTAAPGPVVVAPSSVASLESIGGPAIARGAVTVAPSGIATAGNIPSPTVAPGAVSVAPASLTTGESVPSATLGQGATTVAPSAVGSAESVGAPTLGAGTTVVPDGIASAENLPTAAVTTGGVAVTPDAIASAESIGAAILSAAGGIVAGDIATTEAFGGASLAAGAVGVAPLGIPSDENVNGVAVSSGPTSLAPGSIGGAESFGEPLLSGNRYVATLNSGSADATENSSGNIFLTTTSGNVNASSPLAAFRFPAIPVPAGATAIHHYLQLYTFSFDDPNLTARLELSANPAALTAANGDISGRTLTENGAVWSGSNIGLNQYNQSPDLAAAFQEVLNLPEWTEGSDILIVLRDNGAGGQFRFDMADNATDRPRLIIDYVIGATAQTVTVEGIPSGEALGEAAVVPGAAVVDVVNGVISEEIVAEPLLTTQQAIDEAGEIASAFRSAGAAVEQGGPVVSAEAVPAAEAFGEMAVVVAFEIVVGDSVASAESVGAPDVAIGVITIGPDGLPSFEAFGPVSLATQVAVSPDGIGSGESVGDGSVTPGVVFIVADAIPGDEAFGAALVEAGVLLVGPDAIASLGSLGAAVVTPGAVAIEPTGVESAEGLGGAALLPGATTVATAGIESAESIGTATLQPGGVAVAPDGIGSAETVGAAIVLPGMATIIPTAIESAESVGAATVSGLFIVAVATGVESVEIVSEATVIPGAAGIAPAGIVSDEAVGAPDLSTTVAIAADSVASAESVGPAMLMPGGVALTPESVVSLESVGALLIMPGGVAVVPAPVVSAEAFGGTVLAVGPVAVAPMGIRSAEAFGWLVLIARFLPSLNVYRVAAGRRVYRVAADGQVYAVPFKRRVYRVEE